MKAHPTEIPDVLLIDLEHFDDPRGRFIRHFDAQVWSAVGIGPFVQDNVSVSARGVLRGLHFQRVNPQGKLVSVMSGRIIDVAVDIRQGSRTYGKWVAVELSSDQPQQLWVPPGFAHGFYVIEGPATVHYRCTSIYEPDHQGGLRWDCPVLKIDWPDVDPVLSERDQVWPSLGGH